MKKVVSVLSAAAVAAGIFTGCSAKSGSKEFSPSLDTEASVTINVNGSWSNFEALEAVAADWNEIYPNVNISYSRVDDYYNILETLVDSDQKPDIVIFNPNTYYTGKDKIIDSLADLSQAGLDTSIYNDGVLDAITVDGKLCIFAWGTAASGFVVNKNILDSLGLSVPQTHDEFIKVCDTLKENGYTPIQGCTDSIYGNILKNECYYRIFGEKDSDEVINALSDDADGCGSCFTDEYSAMIKLVESGYIDTAVNDSIADIYEGNILHFFEGNTPFLCFTTEGFSGMKKRETKSEAFTADPFEYEFVSLPVCGDEKVLVKDTFGGLAAVEGSENEEWAKEFLRFLCCSDEINKMAETKGVPSVLGSGDGKYFSDLYAIPQERKAAVKYMSRLNAVDDSFKSTFYDIANGDIKTPEEAQAHFEQFLSTVTPVE